MSDNSTPGNAVAIAQQLSPELIATFSAMVTIVPEDDSNAMENILTAVLTASTWEALGDPWETDTAEKLAGKTFLIERVTRHDSDIAGGLPYFLVMHGTDMRTGESIAAPTGSLAVMAQLVRAHTSGWLPLFAQLIIAERPTKEGFRPQHLKFVGQPKRTADGGTTASPSRPPAQAPASPPPAPPRRPTVDDGTPAPF